MEEEFEETMDSVQSQALDDTEENSYDDPVAGTIVALVKSKFSKASTARDTEERRWIQAYRNYRGLYGPDVQFTSTEKSRVFVKVTKTKVLAAYGQIVEVLFGNNKFPITIEPTTLPEGVASSVHFESDKPLRDAEADAKDNKLWAFWGRLGGSGLFRGPLAFLAPLPLTSDFECFQRQRTNLKF